MATSKEFLDYYFLGQQTIKNELAVYLDVLTEKNLNIFLRARSGYGKTKLAYLLAKYVKIKTGENYYYYLCDKNLNTLKLDRRIVILDEVHLITNPEWLYPLLDNEKNSFILCTNEFYDIKEPLVRRCIEITFNKYTDQEITEIVNEFFDGNSFPLKKEFYITIAKISRGRPSTALNISNRLLLIFKGNGIPKNMVEFFNCLTTYLGIDSLGYNQLDRRYIEFLKEAGSASLNTIALTLNIDKAIIQEEIEPKLIEDNILKITARGRQI